MQLHIHFWYQLLQYNFLFLIFFISLLGTMLQWSGLLEIEIEKQDVEEIEWGRATSLYKHEFVETKRK